MSELLSYSNILNDLRNFKKAGGSYSSDDFNIYDTPSHKYFKLLFYFGSNSEFGNDDGSGLLAPTWEVEDSINERNGNNGTNDIKYYDYNSAWAYLKLNDEQERAMKLKQFVTLLSDINSNSPWYFTKIGGLTEALERKGPEDGKIEITDKKITITCLPDAFDNRITTLLELYREVTWSWVHKKEIIPANLRKFDMAIYIFESPILEQHFEDDTIGADYGVSYKMIELHNCEFGYNSIKSGWNEIDNQIGANPTYTIDVTFSDCYEISHNNLMMQNIGDVIFTDMINSPANDDAYSMYSKFNSIDPITKSNIALSDSSALDPGQIQIKKNKRETEQEEKLALLKDKINQSTNKIKTFGNLAERNGKQSDQINVQYKTEYNAGFLTNAVGQVAGHLVADVKSLFNRALLGNIYGLSLTQIAAGAKEFMKGDIVRTGMSLAAFAREQQVKNRKLGEVSEGVKEENTNNGKNIYTDDLSAIDETGRTMNDVRTNNGKNIYAGDEAAVIDIKRKMAPISKGPKGIGNIFNGNTIANNL